MTDPATPPGDGGVAGVVLTGLAMLFVLVLAVQLAVWGAFLVPLRIGGATVPVSLVVAAVGNVLLALVAGRLLGGVGALAPGVVWLLVAFTLGSRRSEGDLVVPGTLVGTLFLAVGVLASAAGYVVTSGRARRSRGLQPPT
jgi:hypothetical protein